MVRPRVGLLHYTCPPIVGGVETVLAEQARRLSRRGYPVTVLAGRGGRLADAPDVQVEIAPELDSKHPLVLDVTEALGKGSVPPAFDRLKMRITEQLRSRLDRLDVLIIHNGLTLHFNLPLTAAVFCLKDSTRCRLVSWCHDLSWANPLYLPLLQDREPWSLLRKADPRITTVCVSEQRRQEWIRLSAAPADSVLTIPNGIDLKALLAVGNVGEQLIERLGLEEADVILLAPVRITRRKNLEWAIQAAASLRDSGKTVRLLITGPPGPHNPKSQQYVDELMALRRELRLEDSVRFLFQEVEWSDHYPIDSATLRDLYLLSDAVLLPSTAEGFGLPLGEAILLRVPVVASDLPAFREIAPRGVHFVSQQDGAEGFSAAVRAALGDGPNKIRREVLRRFSWEAIIRDRLEPLLGEV
jgi:glycosyltransferase involved in cell wall biosynthesis